MKQETTSNPLMAAGSIGVCCVAVVVTFIEMIISRDVTVPLFLYMLPTIYAVMAVAANNGNRSVWIYYITIIVLFDILHLPLPASCIAAIAMMELRFKTWLGKPEDKPHAYDRKKEAPWTVAMSAIIIAYGVYHNRSIIAAILFVLLYAGLMSVVVLMKQSIGGTYAEDGQTVDNLQCAYDVLRFVKYSCQLNSEYEAEYKKLEEGYRNFDTVRHEDNVKDSAELMEKVIAFSVRCCRYYHVENPFDADAETGNTGTQYFTGCETREAVTKKFHELCKTLHPDNGGSMDDFIAMQAEYKRVRERL